MPKHPIFKTYQTTGIKIINIQKKTKVESNNINMGSYYIRNIHLYLVNPNIQVTNITNPRFL